MTGSMPLLDFGRTWYNVKDAEAQKEAAIAVYRKTVQNAFKDVRTSLTSQREADAIVAASQAQVDSLRRAVEIARLQYGQRLYRLSDRAGCRTPAVQRRAEPGQCPA